MWFSASFDQVIAFWDDWVLRPHLSEEVGPVSRISMVNKHIVTVLKQAFQVPKEQELKL